MTCPACEGNPSFICDCLRAPASVSSNPGSGRPRSRLWPQGVAIGFPARPPVDTQGLHMLADRALASAVSLTGRKRKTVEPCTERERYEPGEAIKHQISYLKFLEEAPPCDCIGDIDMPLFDTEQKAVEWAQLQLRTILRKRSTPGSQCDAFTVMQVNDQHYVVMRTNSQHAKGKSRRNVAESTSASAAAASSSSSSGPSAAPEVLRGAKYMRLEEKLHERDEPNRRDSRLIFRHSCAVCEVPYERVIKDDETKAYITAKLRHWAREMADKAGANAVSASNTAAEQIAKAYRSSTSSAAGDGAAMMVDEHGASSSSQAVSILPVQNVQLVARKDGELQGWSLHHSEMESLILALRRKWRVVGIYVDRAACSACGQTLEAFGLSDVYHVVEA